MGGDLQPGCLADRLLTGLAVLNKRHSVPDNWKVEFLVIRQGLAVVDMNLQTLHCSPHRMHNT